VRLCSHYFILCWQARAINNYNRGLAGLVHLQNIPIL
jgi:hypothetical protein